MQWKFFLAACFLTAALLSPHAGLVPVAIGMVLGGLILLAVSKLGSLNPRK